MSGCAFRSLWEADSVAVTTSVKRHVVSSETMTDPARDDGVFGPDKRALSAGTIRVSLSWRGGDIAALLSFICGDTGRRDCDALKQAAVTMAFFHHFKKH